MIVVTPETASPEKQLELLKIASEDLKLSEFIEKF
jgi:hypothetical protein